QTRVKNGGFRLDSVSETSSVSESGESLEGSSKAYADAMFSVMKLNLEMQKINIDADLNTIKVQSEEFLKEMRGGEELMYNKAATSAYDLLSQNKMQCYSGTVYHTFQYRSGLRKQYVNKNPVVI